MSMKAGNYFFGPLSINDLNINNETPLTHDVMEEYKRENAILLVIIGDFYVGSLCNKFRD